MVSQSPRCTPTRKTPNRATKKGKEAWAPCQQCGVRVLQNHNCDTPGAFIGDENVKLYSVQKDTMYCHMHPDTLMALGLKISTVVKVANDIYECWPDSTILLDQVGINVHNRALVSLEFVDNVRNAAHVNVRCSGPLELSYLPVLLQNKIIFSGQNITLPYFNKDFNVTVISVADFPDQAADKSGDIAKVTNSLAQVSLAPTYCKVLPSTVFSEKKLPQRLPSLIGCSEIIDKVTKIINASLKNSEIFGTMGPPKTILITGPSGSGKSLVVKKILQDVDLPSSEISNFGRQIPCDEKVKIIHLDGIDSIRDDDFESIKRIETFVRSLSNDKLVIGTASLLPGTLKKLFPLSIQMPPVNSLLRYNIFKLIIDEVRDGNIKDVFLTDDDLKAASEKTNGYVGADICNVCRQALILSEYGNLTMQHLLSAITKTPPLAMSDIRIEVPEVTWEDIGGLKDVQKLLTEVITWPIIFHDKYQALGIVPPKGVLLYGPPGCCKTMMAKALATESGLNFLSVKGPELLSMYVGESERAVRNLFARARTASPAIIFFDEIDALASHRGLDKGSGVNDRVIAQLLAELDGVEGLTGVIIIAATNRPDRIDKALLRPGRLEKLIYIPPPDLACRKEILGIKFKKIPHDDSIDFMDVAEKMEGFSGAEVTSVCHSVAIKSISSGSVTSEDVITTIRSINPQVKASDIEFYKNFNIRDAKLN